MVLVASIAGRELVSGWLSQDALAFILLGFVVGLMVGLTSVGAGAIATPVLILLLQVPPLVAVGSAIVSGAITKAVGSLIHGRRDAIDPRLVRNLLWGSMPGVALAVFSLYWLRHHDLALANIWVDRFLGLALVALGVCALARDSAWVRRWRVGKNRPAIGPRAMIIGAVVGFLFGSTSIGSGSLLVVLLSIFLPLSEVHVVGSAILYGFAISLFGSLLHIAWGTVSWQLVLLLSLGSLPGVVAGSALAAHAPHRFLRTCFSLAAVLIGWRLI